MVFGIEQEFGFCCGRRSIRSLFYLVSVTTFRLLTMRYSLIHVIHVVFCCVRRDRASGELINTWPAHYRKATGSYCDDCSLFSLSTFVKIPTTNLTKSIFSVFSCSIVLRFTDDDNFIVSGGEDSIVNVWSLVDVVR